MSLLLSERENRKPARAIPPRRDDDGRTLRRLSAAFWYVGAALFLYGMYSLASALACAVARGC